MVGYYGMFVTFGFMCIDDTLVGSIVESDGSVQSFLAVCIMIIVEMKR